MDIKEAIKITTDYFKEEVDAPNLVKDEVFIAFKVLIDLASKVIQDGVGLGYLEIAGIIGKEFEPYGNEIEIVRKITRAAAAIHTAQKGKL